MYTFCDFRSGKNSMFYLQIPKHWNLQIRFNWSKPTGADSSPTGRRPWTELRKDAVEGPAEVHNYILTQDTTFLPKKIIKIRKLSHDPQMILWSNSVWKKFFCSKWLRKISVRTDFCWDSIIFILIISRFQRTPMSGPESSNQTSYTPYSLLHGLQWRHFQY